MSDVIAGSLPAKAIRYEPDPLITEYLNFNQPTATSNGVITYNGDINVLKLNGRQPSFPVKLTILNSFDQESVPYTVQVMLKCKVTSD